MSRSSISVEDHFLTCSFMDKTEWTVGQVRKVFCESQKGIKLSTPLNVQFLNKTNKYALKILSVEKIDNNKVLLNVTGYQVGKYNKLPFMIVHENQKYVVKDLSWEITSVLKKDQTQVQMHPPYGPWNETIPYWYLSCVTVLAVISLSYALFKIKQFFDQSLLIKQVNERLKNQTPIKYFISQMSPFFTSKNKYKDKKEFLNYLKVSVLEYLENKFFISTIDLNKGFKKNISKKIRNLKITSNEKKELLSLYSEMNKLSEDVSMYDEKDLNRLLNSAKTWIFDYESNEESK